MVNYQNGKIYKIVCNKTGLCYIGSTTKKYLCDRLVEHRNKYKLRKNGKCNYTTSFKILENDDYDIILLENYPCNSKDELRARERFYIENNECVNKNKPIISTEEKKEYFNKYKEEHKQEIKEYNKKWYEENKQKMKEYNKKWYEENKQEKKQEKKEYNKKWYEENKQKMKEYYKKWYEENKQEKKEHNKKYYEDNKQEIKKYYEEYNKKYYQENKEKLNKKINCDCGGKYIHIHKARHFKSIKHQDYLKKVVNVDHQEKIRNI